MAPNGFSDDGMGSLRVEVQDFKSGVPLEGAQVLVTPCNYSGTTDSNGEVLFEQVTPFRNYQVEVALDGYIMGAAGFVAVGPHEPTESIIPLKTKAVLTGRVFMQLFFGLFRWPLPNAQVKLQLESDGSFITIGQIETDTFGRYTFEDLDEGDYRISAEAEGFTAEFKQITITSGRTNRQPLSLRWQWDGLELTSEANPLDVLTTDSVPSTADTSPPALSCMSDATTMDSITFSNQFFPSNPEAVPSVIPGPSELPYLYNDQVFTSSTGSRFVAAGTPVYLRGFAVDSTLLTPQEFNPDAPCFDVYGNKNGNFSASLFDYSWTLRDGDGTDYTDLLNPSSTSENVFFEVPEDREPGDIFIAALTVTNDKDMVSTPEEITLVVAENIDETTCATSGCHDGPDDPPATYTSTRHFQVEGGAGCQDCHGLGSEHISEHPAAEKMSTSYWSGTCGRCHEEFAELQKTNHTDPLPFGYYEPTEGRLTVCYPCHYTPGYIGAIDSGEDFHVFNYEPSVLTTIPRDTPNVSCSVCHDPHAAGEGNPYGLRTGSAGTACDTCHYEKWQNAILEGMAGPLGNGYHYPGEDYGGINWHRTEDKCVLCHMNTATAATDESGVLTLGGHTFRMRDFGPDNTPDTDDDLLNVGACQNQGCHPDLTDFDRNRVQTEVQELLDELRDLLMENNHDFLPANKPGNCARCHKGGTVEFLDDPDLVLENAYTNYKLIANDRSRGIHNPGYIKKLLQDSINSINNDY
jgi:hypothetical protein